MAAKKTTTSKADADKRKSADQQTPEVELSEDVTDTSDQAGQSVDTETESDLTEQQDVQPEEAQGSELTEEPALDEAAEEQSQTSVEDLQPAVTENLAVKEVVVERKGGFVPMVLGGLVAAGLGYGASHFGMLQNSASDAEALQQQISERFEQQGEEIAALSSSIANASPKVDLSGIETAQNDIKAGLNGLSDRFGAVETQLTELDTRLSDVEKRPITEGASDAAVAAYERELKALQDAMAAQRAEIESMAADALSMEASAEETAQATMQRAALTRIQTALDTGTGFAGALADLEKTGITAPDALVSVAQNGVSSLAILQESFPDAARSALTEARRAAAQEGEGGGFGDFLKTQFGARSLEPREGNDPDAILSRAEAALREGRVTDTLAEIEGLREEGRAAMADWAAQANLRLNAIAAAETLSQDLN